MSKHRAAACTSGAIKTSSVCVNAKCVAAGPEAGLGVEFPVSPCLWVGGEAVINVDFKRPVKKQLWRVGLFASQYSDSPSKVPLAELKSRG